ncbi:hypothetical protein JOB18_015017 [Solea senegalensis]|uniref:Uncharacterized protein n=1 Tax=Solea senegalensis TaxID=28829 RepID=A0AAV6T5V8_SOLSE|nr:hypothetical protein JOB18_015017 [Solea senegalensis]
MADRYLLCSGVLFILLNPRMMLILERTPKSKDIGDLSSCVLNASRLRAVSCLQPVALINPCDNEDKPQILLLRWLADRRAL